MNNGQGDLPYTPRRAQKCLFAPSKSNFCKKNASQDSNCGRDAVSGEDSDLGPMSPLAFTDRSPSLSDSSSGREFMSPFATPEKSFTDASVSWDRLTSKHNKEDHMSPFSSLKKITRAARYSPRCKLTNNSRSLPSSPRKLGEPSTPQRSKIMSLTMDEIVPETPQRSFATEIQNQSITETPRKSRTPECRQITPLNSISRTAPLPKLHRRKSFSGLEMDENFSPEQKENTLKRRAHDQLTVKPAKLFKTDDVSVPRARAALFQERKNESNNLKNISLSTKTFYSSNAKIERPFVFGNFSNSDVKKRRSLPVQNINRRSLLKKQKFGKINAGVFHGIKKLKKPKVKPEILKKEEHVTQNSATSNKSPPTNEVQTNAIVEKTASPEIVDSKRFFKTKRSGRPNHSVTVMNQKHSLTTNVHKQRMKTADICLDTTDLTVDEPEIEATLEQDKVNNLLKILEDDWAADDYDTMEPLTSTANMISPLKPTTMLAENAIMSPATELSNMTLTMNIKDVTSLTNFGNLSIDNTDNNNDVKTGEDGKEYFPLFNKGYSTPNNIFEYVLYLCYIYKSQIIFIIITKNIYPI